MVIIGVHTQPKYAANETGALANVYDYAAKTFKTKVWQFAFLIIIYYS